jgi:hypothetical protein
MVMPRLAVDELTLPPVPPVTVRVQPDEIGETAVTVKFGEVPPRVAAVPQPLLSAAVNVPEKFGWVAVTVATCVSATNAIVVVEAGGVGAGLTAKVSATAPGVGAAVGGAVGAAGLELPPPQPAAKSRNPIANPGHSLVSGMRPPGEMQASNS